MSIGKLWFDIDKLDVAGHEGTSATTERGHWENSPPQLSSGRSNRETA
jgi:hypothetical protein